MAVQQELIIEPEIYVPLIARALAEDHAQHDVTSAGCIDAGKSASLNIVGRQDLVLAGRDIALAVFRIMVPDLGAEIFFADGDAVPAGRTIMRLTGSARGLLGAERVALNTLQFMSAIATHTRAMVDEISHTRARFRDTRKTVPGMRILSKYAVRAGGGTNHRFSLADAVLIKDNHIALNGGSVRDCIQSIRATTSLPIQIECDTLDQLQTAIEAGADQILLDNMSLQQLSAAVRLVQGTVPLEASGGVTLQTIRKIAETGVDYISAGCVTQAPPAVDIGLDWLND